MVKRIKVVPGILAGDPRALEIMVREAETFTDYAQFDFMDGQYPDILSFLAIQPLENSGHFLPYSSLKVSGQTSHLAYTDSQAKPVP